MWSRVYSYVIAIIIYWKNTFICQNCWSEDPSIPVEQRNSKEQPFLSADSITQVTI